jgi:phosphoglycerate kinase
MPQPTFSLHEVAGETVFLRADFNITMDESGQILDRYRIIETLPTIRALQSAGARIVIGSHLGRPDGARDERWTLRPIASCLGELLGTPVRFAEDCIGATAEAAAAALEPGELLLLENLRFHAGEEENDPAFAQQLARLATRYVTEAFGTMHRRHASIVGIPEFLPAMPGMLVERELDRLSHLMDEPEAPLGLLLGGAKVQDKLPLVERLLPRAKIVCIGGAMATSIQQHRSGLLPMANRDRDHPEGGQALRQVCDLLTEAEESGAIRLVLPTDAIASLTRGGQTAVTSTSIDNVPGWKIRDIGAQTLRAFEEALSEARTIFWNGPLGMFEDPSFSRGSLGMAAALARMPARVVAGGGDTVAAIHMSQTEDHFWHLSTGGGATLSFLSGDLLPGIEALRQAIGMNADSVADARQSSVG